MCNQIVDKKRAFIITEKNENLLKGERNFNTIERTHSYRPQGTSTTIIIHNNQHIFSPL